MRIGEILINSSGVNQNPALELINASPITGDAGSTLYSCQVTIECFNTITQTINGLYVPVLSSVVTSGLTGTLSFNIYPSKYCPYAVIINPSNQINIADSCILQWTGVVDHITVTATSVTGCSYIRILLDRN